MDANLLVLLVAGALDPDIDLYLAASKEDPSSAVNYRHLQERYAPSY